MQSTRDRTNDEMLSWPTTGARTTTVLFRIACVAALLYAFVAGLHTVTDWDLGWQLATGRWVAQHHQIPSSDVFSYTSPGEPWIYPIGSGLIFYWLYLLGSYSALSCLGAITCVGTVALLLRKGSSASALLSIFAIPVIADRTTPRADMFTVLLFAAFLSILWEQFSASPPSEAQSGRARLWLLPLLMIAWVNLHLGFVAGLGLVFTYAAIEALEMLWPVRRRASLDRLRRAWPWLIATFAAVLVNPWGWRIVQALLRQQNAMDLHSQSINEWASVRLNWNAVSASFTERDPKNAAIFILLAIAFSAVLLSLWRRQFGAAIMLSAAAVLAFRHMRFTALFGLVVVVVGGAVLMPVIETLSGRIRDQRLRAIASAGAVSVALILICTRSADLISSHAYLSSSTELATFGTGLSWWFPDRAAAFVERENLPAQLFNTYNEGGFVAWRLGLRYPDYIDGRAIPFGTALFRRSAALLNFPPQSPQWQQEAERYGIRSMIIPLGRYDALQYFPVLQQFCTAGDWRPVYLDEVSAVFVRRTPETEGLIQRLQINCATSPIPAVRPGANDSAAFNQWSNAAAVLFALGRNSESYAATTQALNIFSGNAMLHIIRGNLLAQSSNAGVAEQEYLLANSLEPTGYSWATLAVFYGRQGRSAEQIQAWQHVADLAPLQASSAALLQLGNAYLSAHQPQQALQSLDEAVDRLPTQAASDDEIRPLRASLAHTRAVALSTMGDFNRAVASEEEAVQLAPDRAEQWTALAALYDRLGRHEDAQHARERSISPH